MSTIPLAFPVVAAVIGMIAAVPLGPVNLEIIRRVLDRHRLSAVAFAVGAAVADGIWPMVCYLGLSPLMDMRWVAALFWGIASMLLIFLGIHVIRDAVHPHKTAAPRAFVQKKRLAVIAGFIFVITNPTTLVSWVAIISLLDQLGILPPVSRMTALVFWLSVSLGSLTYFAVLIFFVNRHHHALVLPKRLRLIKIVFGCIILGVAAYLGYHFARLFWV